MAGFIPGSRGTFMLDFVACAMIAVLPLMYVAIQLAANGKYRLHKIAMTTLVGVLLVVVAFFEYEMRTVGWLDKAQPSPYNGNILSYVLGVHLVFSVSTTIGLIMTVLLALKNFASPPRPSAYSESHRRLGKASAVGLFCTSLTGWMFYWMAFVSV